MCEMYWLICYDSKRVPSETFPDFVENECVCGNTLIEAWEHLVNRLKETWPEGEFRLLGARPDVAPDNFNDDEQFNKWYDKRKEFCDNVARLVGRCQDKGILAK